MTEDDEAPKLPDILPVGSAIKTSTSKEGLFTTWYHDRFSPTQKLRGEISKQNLQDKIQARKEARRSSNLREHFQRLEDINDGDIEAPDTTVGEQLAFEWVENVQDVDPNDIKLSAFWYAVFSQIKGGNSNAK
ncbi:MAG: hypothetical protein AAFR74_02625, partial [Pseudomonadota bacterium]